MNELSDLLLALIDLRINTQLNNSNFLRKYTGYVASVDGENVKVMMDFVDKDKDEVITNAYSFINKTGSINIQKGDNVEIICNKDFNNGYINKNLSVKQIAVTTYLASSGGLEAVLDNKLSKVFDLSHITDSIASIVSLKNFSFADGVGKGIVEFRGANFVWDDNAILTHVKHPLQFDSSSS